MHRSLAESHGRVCRGTKSLCRGVFGGVPDGLDSSSPYFDSCVSLVGACRRAKPPLRYLPSPKIGGQGVDSLPRERKSPLNAPSPKGNDRIEAKG